MDAREFRKARAGRNYALAAFLFGLVALFFAITVVKFGGAS